MKQKIWIFLALIMLVVIVVGLKTRKHRDCVDGCAGGFCLAPIPAAQLDPNHFSETSAANALPRLLDLGAGKCIPCKAMAPILDEMKETFAGRLNVEFIDVWENEAAKEEYAVRMIPTQIFFAADGNELFRHEGFYAREDILAKWNELGYDFN